MSFGCCHGDASHGEELLRAIDFNGVRCLNESIPGSCVNVLKAACSRSDHTRFLDSTSNDTDLLLSIPFTSTIQLRAICVSGDIPPHSSPARVRLFINRPDLDFTTAAEATPVQDFLLRADFNGDIWHSVRAARFNNLSSLQLFFSGRLGIDDEADDDVSGGCAVRIFYVGLRADISGRRVGAVHTTYETQALRADHTVPDDAHAQNAALR